MASIIGKFNFRPLITWVIIVVLAIIAIMLLFRELDKAVKRVFDEGVQIEIENTECPVIRALVGELGIAPTKHPQER